MFPRTSTITIASSSWLKLAPVDEFDPGSVLTPAALAAAHGVCATDLFVQFLGQPASAIVPPGQSLDANEPRGLTLQVPTLVVQGTADVEIFEPLTLAFDQSIATVRTWVRARMARRIFEAWCPG